ncbi:MULTISPECIES: hypothetical protein [unclassified Bradyrhizobium]|uniref:hypothetical protein n=1 Tax=unclassified Bradyrhizobium TaxID=2631580 RepID=UPI001FF7D82A|nr:MULTISPECIES: hypothetical protein [unclassified Bradyrhizobium]
MSAQFGARFAAVGTAGGRPFRKNLVLRGVVLAATVAAAGCTPTTTRLAGADPADPSARVAGVGYRSTVAPYTGLRPSTPTPWRERNEKVAPQPGNGRQPR